MEKVNNTVEKMKAESKGLASSLLKMKAKLAEYVMENRVYFVAELKKKAHKPSIVCYT